MCAGRAGVTGCVFGGAAPTLIRLRCRSALSLPVDQAADNFGDMLASCGAVPRARGRAGFAGSSNSRHSCRRRATNEQPSRDWIPARPFRMPDRVFATDVQRSSGLGDGQTQRLQTQFPEHFARVRRVVHLHQSTSVIVLIIHALSILAGETERHSPIATHFDRPGAFRLP